MSFLIDPGHGGFEHGASIELHNEKDINLLASSSLAGLLCSKGYIAALSRTDDSRITLGSRIRHSYRYSDIISVHCNAHKNPSSCGFEVFYKKHSKNSKTLAESICNNVTSIKMRGAKPNNTFYMLKNAPNNAILIELGFMTNKHDLEMLLDYKQLNNLLGQIIDGIVAIDKC